MKHAEVLIERILFLDGIPSMEPLELTVGGNVKAMIQTDLSWRSAVSSITKLLRSPQRR